jgi:hypothetical protein
VIPANIRAASSTAWVAAAFIACLVAVVWFLTVDGGRGLLAPLFSMPAVATTAASDGDWLSNLVVWLMGALPWRLPTMLTIFSICVIGALLAWLYRRLIYNGWSIIEAVCLVACLAGHSVVIASIVADHRAIPVMLACAAIVPAIRRLESVGDAQAEMSFGLVLPLLFLAGPTTTLLIPMLAVFGAASDPLARSDHRAFIAMFLVAIMPTTLVLVGIFGMLGGGEAARIFQTVYVAAFKPQPHLSAALVPLSMMAAYTILPFAILIGAYCLNKDRRRQPWSAVAVLVLPAYLIAGTVVFAWPMLASTPTAVFLGAFASWLSVARLSPLFRAASVTLMLLGSIVSWSAPVLTNDLRVIGQTGEP